METVVRNLPQRIRKSVPDHTPLEAGNIACSACGSILEPKVIKGPRNIEGVEYTCKNEEYGCNYILTRKVPVMNSEIHGIRPDGTLKP